MAPLGSKNRAPGDDPKRIFAAWRRSATTDPKQLAASAATINQAQLRSTLSAGRTAAWQDTAWTHFDQCGELRFGCNWLGNLLSRARIFAAYIEDSEDEPVAIEEGVAAEIAAAIHGGAAGQSQMLQRAAVHLSVPGETWIVTWGAKAGPQQWATLCSDEIESTGDNITIMLEGQRLELPADDSHVMRIWRPHPRKHWEADSPVRGLLPVLHELERLSQHVLAQTESRLSGAGLLLIPDNISFPVEGPDGEITVGNNVGEFLQVLAQSMITPISNRDSASAVVPIIAQAPAEAIAAVKHLSFATDLDSKTMEMRAAAIRRLALGMDMPPEVLLGLSDANHWSAWEISDNAVSQHAEPLLATILAGLTTQYLRPALAAAKVPESGRYVLAADTSELVTRPNRGPDALALYDKKELSGSALRREYGFGEADAPVLAELAQRELKEILGNSALAEPAVHKILEMLGFVRPGQLPDAPGPAAGPPAPPGPAQLPGPPPAPRAIPQRPDSAPTPPGAAPPPPAAAADTALAVQAVALFAATHALEYAGKRLLSSDRSFRARFREVPHHLLHTRIRVTRDGDYRLAIMLDGAFRTFDQMPEFARVRAAVENHVTELLLGGRPLDRRALYDDIARILT